MPTHADLALLFGETDVITLDRENVEGNGLRPEDVEILCEVGLPVNAGIVFTMDVHGPYDTFTMFEAETDDRTARFLILGQGRGGGDVAHADDIRFAMELESGNVFLLGLADGEFTGDAETINTSLAAFVEFLYRVALRDRELAGSTAEEARPYTERLIEHLRARDERALVPGTFWSGLLTALLDTGVPEARPGSRPSIAAALDALVPDDKPLRWATDTPVGEGIQELTAHRADGHWLLVTWGFTDLDGLVDLDSDDSGLGFELTMRVPRTDDDEMPPGWALQTLRNLGEYVFTERHGFGDGHRMSVAGTLGPDPSRLAALLFVTDPDLGTIDTPGGRVEFVTAVGVTPEELDEAKDAGNNAVLSRFTPAGTAPLTDVTR